METENQIVIHDEEGLKNLSGKVTKQDLIRMYNAKVIDKNQFKEDLFKLETEIKPKKSRKPKRLPVAMNEEEFISLFKATKRNYFKLAFLLGYGAGLRISEILKLQPRHININEKKIIIESGKGQKDRIVPLPKGITEKQLKLLPLKYKNYISGARCLEYAFKSAAKKAGLLEKKPSLHFHSLRHAFATNAVSKNIPIHHIRTLMGHSNIATTNIYLEANPKEALKDYEKMFWG